MRCATVSAEVKRHRIPWCAKLRLGRLGGSIIVVIIIGGIHHQAVQQNYPVPAQLLFERAPDDSILHRLTPTRRAVREREVPNVMNEVPGRSTVNLCIKGRKPR